jgi:hypothetical protein
MLRHGLQEARRILDSGNDVAVDLGQQPDEALPKQHRIIRHDHAHALYAATLTSRRRELGQSGDGGG